MSLQSRTSIFTPACEDPAAWSSRMKKFPVAIAFLLALLLVLPQAYGQTVSTRTSLSVAKEDGKTTLSVTVKDPFGAVVSGGTVTFQSGNTSLGSAFVKEDGTATLTLDSLPAGVKQITAVYSGNGNHAASASASANVQAEDTTSLPDFSISASPTSLSLNPGGYGTVIITVTPTSTNFTQSVTLTISGLPNASTSSFTPQIVTPVSGGAVNSTLQIQTTAASGAKNDGLPFGGNASHVAYALVFPGIMALAGIGALGRRSGLRLMGIALLLLASMSGLTACSQRYGYLNHPPTSNPGTPAGSYTVTVTAYSNNGGQVTSHSLQLALTVK
jgi:hypothetical protein